jgi:hypothetical protein
MKRKIRAYSICMVFMLLSLYIYAGDPPNPNKPPPPHPELAIDGGLSFLLIAGIAFGVYRIKRRGLKSRTSCHIEHS